MTHPPHRPEIQELVARHALGWLLFANGVGLLLATLLIVPAWNADLAPFTYGRWVPVHYNAQLFGWSSLPLVGLLLRAFLPARGGVAAAGWSLSLWSAALAFGCVSWLAGWTTAKPFVEWAGPARLVLCGMLFGLAVILAGAYAVRRRTQPEGRAADGGKIALLALLFAVPFAMYSAARPDHYPPINPDSGGATGGSLLGSTLGIIAIYLAAPRLAGFRTERGCRGDLGCWLLFALHAAVFALLDHGDRSHHERSQILALSSLVVWVPVLRAFLLRFEWPAAARPWLGAMLGWGAALVVSASVTFLPGVLERAKFTHALVAHSHLAMAGLVTSFNMVLLISLAPEGPLRRALGHPYPFAAWQLGLLVHLIVLSALGELEAVMPHVLFRPHGEVDTLFTLRLLSGVALFIASAAWWWASAAKRDNPPDTAEVLP